MTRRLSDDDIERCGLAIIGPMIVAVLLAAGMVAVAVCAAT